MKPFELSDKEQESFREFYETHKSCGVDNLNKHFFSTEGGHFTFMFTPLGIGTIIRVRCNGCGEEKDITDKDSW